MPSVFKVDFPGFAAKVELASGGWAEMGQGLLVRLYGLFWELHTAVPVALLEVKQTAAGPPVVLSYDIGPRWAGVEAEPDVRRDGGSRPDVRRIRAVAAVGVCRGSRLAG